MYDGADEEREVRNLIRSILLTIVTFVCGEGMCAEKWPGNGSASRHR